MFSKLQENTPISTFQVALTICHSSTQTDITQWGKYENKHVTVWDKHEGTVDETEMSKVQKFTE